MNIFTATKFCIDIQGRAADQIYKMRHMLQSLPTSLKVLKEFVDLRIFQMEELF